jgi:flagellar biosynthetic protein FliS
MGNRELTAYREADIQGASSVELVIKLYDVLMRDMRQVIVAIRAGEVEERVNQSNHAFAVLQELECLLDMENGGSTAKDLSRFYSHLRAKVMEVQFKLDPALLETQIGMVLELRQGWQQVLDRSSIAPTPAERVPLTAELVASPYASIEERQCCGWSA